MTIRILLSMNEDFLKKVDNLAKNEKRTRSALIRKALIAYANRAETIDPQKANAQAEILEQLLD